MGDGAVNGGRKSTDYTPNLTVPLFEKHPTPWRLMARHPRNPLGIVQQEFIVDANGREVLRAQHGDAQRDTWFEGDICSLVDFINAVGPAMPRLLRLDAEDRLRRAAEPGYNPDNNLDLLVQRLNETKPWET